MVWFKVDDKLHDHRKVRKAGDAAIGVWVLAGSWCACNATEGFVPADLLPRWTRRPQAVADRLCDVGLWYPDEQDGDAGYRFHDWNEYQPTQADLNALRQQKVAAGRAGGQASARARAQAPATPRARAPAEAESKQSREAESNPVPSRPDPTTTEPTVPPTTAQTLVADWIDRCQARPPSRVIGQVAKHVAELLAEGTDPDHIRQGLDLWQRKGLHPSTLASVVNEAMNSSPYAVVKPKPSTTDAKLAQTLSLLGQYERQELTSG